MAVKLMSRDDMLQRLKETNNPKLSTFEECLNSILRLCSNTSRG